jgi:hypothetical protein
VIKIILCGLLVLTACACSKPPEAGVVKAVADNCTAVGMQTMVEYSMSTGYKINCVKVKP